MRTKNKIITACLITTATISTIALINKLIFLSADKKSSAADERLAYDWRFGNVSYTKKGNGKPLLLIHDLLMGNSDIEWKYVVKKLSENHTVYTLDLPGFGLSDKSAMTYTNYLYVQLVTDFVKSVIGKRTDVIASGSSAGIAVMTCCNDASLFDRIMLVNPDSLKKAGQIPSKRTKILKLLIECPVVGTLLFNIMMSKTFLKNDFAPNYFANPDKFNRDFLDSFHESAHRGGYDAKYIFASIKGNYTNFSISHKLASIDNSIYIVAGTREPSIGDTIFDYHSLNPAIESSFVEGCKHFPQIEKPEKFLQLCDIFFV